MKSNDEYLVHHGIKGMKWGVRRFRNKDGSLTSAGKKRYDGDSVSDEKKSKWKKGRKVAAIVGGAVTAAGAAAGGAVAIKKATSSKKANARVDTITSSDGSSKKNKKDIWKRTIKKGKDKEKVSPAEEFANKGNTIVQESVKAGTKIIDAVSKSKKAKNFKNNAAGKSDQELRAKINRIKLEREYNSLTNEDTSRGAETAKTVLEVVGSVSTVALAAVGIIGTIKNW